MTDTPFISYGQNHEDVVLWRALSGVVAGRYVEVGANHPTDDSITRAFYDRGWSGLTVEPVPAFAALHRQQRPRDQQVEAAVTDAEADEITLHVIPNTGLSTLVDGIKARHVDRGWDVEDLTVPTARLDTLLEATGWGRSDIQFLIVDVEGSEAQVLSTIDLSVWRPWVLVIEATLPNSAESTAGEWEPGVLAAGYEFCLFDGVSRFYVAKEHVDLKQALSYPACVLDSFVPAQVVQLDVLHAQQLATLQKEQAEALASESEKRADTTRQLLFWRARALQAWAAPVASAPSTSLTAELAAARTEITRLLEHIAVMEGTISWRVTAPLRAVRKAQFAISGRGQ
ncbi:FkbM family methyltransferase [Microbacterium sp. BWT-B31]|uniref:FkbM family methyltransferase n=1 Tax=Microbacterium sp. BWT-B31 TaxID=3232072 RepID=UPI0035289AE1